jgi:hypothetical protein
VWRNKISGGVHVRYQQLSQFGGFRIEDSRDFESGI